MDVRTYYVSFWHDRKISLLPNLQYGIYFEMKISELHTTYDININIGNLKNVPLDRTNYYLQK